MKLWKKLLIVLLVLVLLSQIPFAYRRYKLSQLHAAIQQLNSQRKPPEPSGFVEYKGVMHVHSFLGGHSKGGFEEIIAAATSNQLDFVVMTEHTSPNFNTAAMTLKGKYAGVLFVNGNEGSVSDGDRFLVVPGDEQWTGGGGPAVTEELLARTKADGRLVFVAYPDQFKRWDAGEFDGVEVYNVYTNARQTNPLAMFFDGLWSYRSYPDLLFANFYQGPVESLKKWDQQISQTGKRLVAIAGNDSHANVGISLTDSTGETLLGIKLDPYERSFRLVRIHVLLDDLALMNGQLSFESLSDKRLLTGLAAGHAFIGFDLFGDTTGFRFTASDTDENKIMGDEIKLEDEVTLKVSAPVAARIVLLKDGAQIQQLDGTDQMTFVAKEKGSYRVEVYPSQLPRPVADQPWIISNPIYVR